MIEFRDFTPMKLDSCSISKLVRKISCKSNQNLSKLSNGCLSWWNVEKCELKSANNSVGHFSSALFLDLTRHILFDNKKDVNDSDPAKVLHNENIS